MVLGIIGLIVGITVPSLLGAAKRLRLKTATRETIGLIHLARSLAISTHADYAVVVDADHGEIRVVNVGTGTALEKAVHLPSTVTAEVQVGGSPAAEPELVFRPSGSLSGRTMAVVLADKDRQQTITVTGPTGTVAVQ